MARRRAAEVGLTIVAVIAVVYMVAWVQAPWPTALLGIPALAVAVGAGVGAVRLSIASAAEEGEGDV